MSSGSASANSGSSGSSSAARTISILRSYSSAIARIDSSVSVWVSVAISPIIISFLITSAGARPMASPSSRTVAPELTLVASGSTGVLRTPSAAPPAAGDGDGHRDGAADAAAADRPSGRGGRPASRSRRGVFCPRPHRRPHRPHRRRDRPGRTGLFDVEAFAGCGGAAGLARPRAGLAQERAAFGARRRAFAAGWPGLFRFRRRLGRVPPPLEAASAFGGVLIDARGGHFGFDSRCFQRRQDLFRADAIRFCDLVNPLFCH